jgi:hypothetical protein
VSRSGIALWFGKKSRFLLRWQAGGRATFHCEILTIPPARLCQEARAGCFTIAQKDTGQYGSIRETLVKHFRCRISTISQNDHNVRFWGNSGQVRAPWHFTDCMSALSADQAAPLWQAAQAQAAIRLEGNKRHY